MTIVWKKKSVYLTNIDFNRNSFIMIFKENLVFETNQKSNRSAFIFPSRRSTFTFPASRFTFPYPPSGQSSELWTRRMFLCLPLQTNTNRYKPTKTDTSRYKPYCRVEWKIHGKKNIKYNHLLCSDTRWTAWSSDKISRGFVGRTPAQSHPPGCRGLAAATAPVSSLRKTAATSSCASGRENTRTRWSRNNRPRPSWLRRRDGGARARTRRTAAGARPRLVFVASFLSSPARRVSVSETRMIPRDTRYRRGGQAGVFPSVQTRFFSFYIFPFFFFPRLRTPSPWSPCKDGRVFSSRRRDRERPRRRAISLRATRRYATVQRTQLTDVWRGARRASPARRLCSVRSDNALPADWCVSQRDGFSAAAAAAGKRGRRASTPLPRATTVVHITQTPSRRRRRRSHRLVQRRRWSCAPRGDARTVAAAVFARPPRHAVRTYIRVWRERKKHELSR